MGVVTTFLNLIKPDATDKWSRLTYNQNLDKLDKASFSIKTVNATSNANGYDTRLSQFTRIIQPDIAKGIIIAEYNILIKTGITLTIPDSNTAGTTIGTITPAGYRPKEVVGYVAGGIISGSGRGDPLQMLVTSAGVVMFRRFDGGTYDLPQSTGSDGSFRMRWAVSYQWDGNF